MASRQINSVHIDIARLVFEFSEISMESTENKDKQIADWTRSLVRSLALRDPSISKYGAHLMAEMEAYRKADSERKQGFKQDKYSKDSKDSKDSVESSQSKVKEIKVKEIKEEKEKNALSAFSQHQFVIDYLNQKTGKKFRLGDSVRKLISARFKEGFTFEDFKKVIDNKTADWLNNPEMEMYLRPSTLFQVGKMDGYLNQKTSGFAVNRRPKDSPEDIEFILTGPAT